MKGKPGLSHLTKRFNYPPPCRYGRLFLAIRLLIFFALLALGFIFIPIPTAIFLGVVVLLGAVWFNRLRWHEKKDESEFVPKIYDADQLSVLHEREDFRIQNQLTHLVEIKPGFFRQFTLRFVLWAIQLLARTIFNRGSLGGIPSIHFARWAIIDGGKRLLFFSNFDGSWESYLGEFIDRAAIGLTGVWTNTKDFPPTRKLIFGGARHSGEFKAWVRSKQIETQVWYSAYKQCTVQNCNNNTEIRNGLNDSMGQEKVLSWLQRLS